MKLLTFGLLLSFVLFSSCGSCSHSGRRHLAQRAAERSSHSNQDKEAVSQQKFVIKMEKEHGVYTMPVEVNGVKMSFIFDTGASSISISDTELFFLLKQGKMSNDDIKGEIYFSDATGRVSEGTRVILRSVRIGPITLTDVEASVVHNPVAPLLLGQSALNRFGKIVIDYETESLIIYE